MYLVDTSVWIDFFRGKQTSAVEQLRCILQSEQTVGINSLIYQEILQGSESEQRLVINSDNGPECSGHRTQFLQRLIEFADKTGLIIRRVYYPPYHSKYNAIERLWAGLEKSWNGYLLDSQETVLKRAGNFVWKGKRAIVTMMAGTYEKGVKLAVDQICELEARLERSTALKWWDITISPKQVF